MQEALSTLLFIVMISYSVFTLFNSWRPLPKRQREARARIIRRRKNRSLPGDMTPL